MRATLALNEFSIKKIKLFMDKDLILLNEATLCYKYFMRELFSLQNAFLLQNEPFLLHYATGITEYAVFITKCSRY